MLKTGGTMLKQGVQCSTRGVQFLKQRVQYSKQGVQSSNRWVQYLKQRVQIFVRISQNFAKNANTKLNRKKKKFAKNIFANIISANFFLIPNFFAKSSHFCISCFAKISHFFGKQIEAKFRERSKKIFFSELNSI